MASRKQRRRKRKWRRNAEERGLQRVTLTGRWEAPCNDWLWGFHPEPEEHVALWKFTNGEERRVAVVYRHGHYGNGYRRPDCIPLAWRGKLVTITCLVKPDPHQPWIRRISKVRLAPLARVSDDAVLEALAGGPPP